VEVSANAERSDSVQAEVGLRIVWRGEYGGVITGVEPRSAGGPLVSVRLDEGTEMHGVTVGEWEATTSRPVVQRSGKKAGGGQE
jgi:hypothetical protein